MTHALCSARASPILASVYGRARRVPEDVERLEEDQVRSRPVINADTQVAASNNAISTPVPGGVVILDPVSGHYFGLEGVSVRAWELLAGSASLATLVSIITAEYEVDHATCERDLRRLLEELAERGLVVVEETNA